MAVATTTFTPEPVPFPYSGLPSVSSDLSAMPFGEIRFSVLAGAIDVEAGGDSQLCNVTCNLPLNNAYAVMSIHFSIYGADITEWESSTDSWFTNGFGSAGQGRDYIAPIPSWNEAIVGTVKAFRFDLGNSLVIQPADSVSQPQIRLSLANDTINGSAMAINFHCRVLVFSTEQSYNVAVNAPMPVR